MIALSKKTIGALLDLLHELPENPERDRQIADTLEVAIWAVIALLPTCEECAKPALWQRYLPFTLSSPPEGPFFCDLHASGTVGETPYADELRALLGLLAEAIPDTQPPPTERQTEAVPAEQEVFTPVSVRVYYKNYRNELAWRTIIPKSVRYGATEYHPAPTWLLEVWDQDRQADRTYVLGDILIWAGHNGAEYAVSAQLFDELRARITKLEGAAGQVFREYIPPCHEPGCEKRALWWKPETNNLWDTARCTAHKLDGSEKWEPGYRVATIVDLFEAVGEEK